MTVAPERVLAFWRAARIDDAGLRERLGKSGRARVLEQYDLGRNIPKLAEIFAERVG